MNFLRNEFILKAKHEGHSKQYIEQTLNYADNLVKNDLPVIFSLKHFCLLLNTDYTTISKIIRNRNSYYSYYLIKKKRGGNRRIILPHKPIKQLQDWIKSNIIDKVSPNSYATGFVKKKSILTNAKIHENNNVILNVDLSNFFETITERRIYKVFKSMGYASNLSVDFAKICTFNIEEYKFDKLSEEAKPFFEFLLNLPEPILVQGASTSPGLSNLVCRSLDIRLSKLANKLGANYSRYADDITFSGNEESIPNVVFLNKIILDEGFNINWSKVGYYKVGQKQLVTGLLINGTVRIPQKFKKDIFRHLHFCKKFGAAAHFNRISPDKGYRKEWLLGKILFVHSIEPDEAKKMFKLVDQIDWEI